MVLGGHPDSGGVTEEAFCRQCVRTSCSVRYNLSYLICSGIGHSRPFAVAMVREEPLPRCCSQARSFHVSSTAHNTCRGYYYEDLRSFGPGTEVAPKAVEETKLTGKFHRYGKASRAVHYSLGPRATIGVLSKRYVPETTPAPLVIIPAGHSLDRCFLVSIIKSGQLFALHPRVFFVLTLRWHLAWQITARPRALIDLPSRWSLLGRCSWRDKSPGAPYW